MSTTHEARNPTTILDAFLHWQRITRGAQPHTVRQYGDVLRQYVDWLDGRPLDGVSLADADSFLTRSRKRLGTRPPAPATLAREVATLKSFHRFASSRGYLAINPAEALTAPRVRNKNPKPVDDTTWMQLWSCDALPTDARAALGLGYFVGLRRAEITALERRHVDTVGMQIVGLERKGGCDDVLQYGDLVQIIEHALPQLVPGGAARFTDSLRQMTDETGLRSAPIFDQWTRGLCELGPASIYAQLRSWLRLADLPEDAFTPAPAPSLVRDESAAGRCAPAPGERRRQPHVDRDNDEVRQGWRSGPTGLPCPLDLLFIAARLHAMCHLARCLMREQWQ